jgi:uncharacterized protein YjcR
MDKDGLAPRTHYRTSKSTTGRRKGGQPGNKNALRHGFYSKLFTVEERALLDKDTASDHILATIKAMQVKALRLFKLTPLNQIDEEQLKTFDRFIQAMHYINTAERTLLLARGHGGQIGDDILTALREMNPYEDLE